MYKYIQLQQAAETATIWLNRPEKRNAFHEDMVSELLAVLDQISREEDIKALIIRGKGPVFCSGADLSWLQGVINYSFNENQQESKKLFQLFHTLYTYPLPVVTVVHGACYGGANGLAAASDIVLAESAALFSFPEVRLGLVPATIAPFVIRRIGQARARELMLTGKKFNAATAQQYGLVTHSLPSQALEDHLEKTLKQLCAAPVGALRSTRWLIGKISQTPQLEDLEEITARMIARARLSEEGQEGMKAFAEKRKPQWKKTNQETTSHDAQQDK